MSTHDINDSEILAVKDGLAKLGQSIETIAKRELPKQEFLNNELSGDKIHGGTITEFSSVGIQDKAHSTQLVVENDLVTVSNFKADLLKGKVKRFKGILGRRVDTKKAIVTLVPGNTIDLSVGA